MSYRHCNGIHDMATIMEKPAEAPGVSYVTRWCRNCGSVAVDTDVDGRTSPGDRMPMKFSRLADEVVRRKAASGVPDAAKTSADQRNEGGA